MATDQPTPRLHPGDIIQDSTGLLMLVTQIKPRFVGAVQRWHDGIEMQERYHRLKHGAFVRVGAAHLLPEDIAGARRDSIAQAARDEAEATRRKTSGKR